MKIDTYVIRVGDSTVPPAIVIYIDGRFIKNNIAVKPIYHVCDSNSFNKDIRMCLARHSDMQKPSVSDLVVENLPAKSVHRRREPKYAQMLSQNTRGFDDEKEDSVLALMQKKKIFAYCLSKKLGSWK